MPLGIQILAGANSSAVAAASACGASRARRGFRVVHVADEGLIEPSAGTLLRYRRAIGASQIKVFADVKEALGARHHGRCGYRRNGQGRGFLQADGVIVSGISTGEPAAPDDVRRSARPCRRRRWSASGISLDNLGCYPDADAFIVGSSISVKASGRTRLTPSAPGCWCARSAAVANATEASVSGIVVVAHLRYRSFKIFT